MRLLPSAAVAAILLATPIAAGEPSQMSDENAVLETIATMTEAFARGDIEAVMSTYAAPATVVAEPGKPVSGDAALRAMFADFVAAGVKFTYGAHEVVVAGDTALHLMRWQAPVPNEVDVEALSVAVLQRQPDGGWKMVIDHPFGDAVMRAP